MNVHNSTTSPNMMYRVPQNRLTHFRTQSLHAENKHIILIFCWTCISVYLS